MIRVGLAATLAFAGGIAVAAQLPSAGATLDPAMFEYARDIAAGRAALVVLPLDAAVLAHSRGPYGRFADVRVVDPSNRQLPYLLEEGSEPLELEVQLGPFEGTAEPRRSDGHHRSTYSIVMPYPRLPGAELVLETSQRTFRREVQLSERRLVDGPRKVQPAAVIANRVWQHADESVAAPPLVLAARDRESPSLILTVDEGDNAPLPLTSARLRLPAWRLRLYRPEGTPLRLLYGNRDAVAPEYDLALLRAKIMEESAEEISASAEPLKKDKAAIVSPRVFWGFLIAAVVVLVALIARLATSRSSEDPSPPSAPRP